MSDPFESPPHRVLVIRLGAIGDVVRTRFAFAELREHWPATEFDWLVEDRARGGLDGVVGLSRVVSVPRSELRLRHPLRGIRAALALVRELRERSYDLVLDFHGVLKSGLYGWLSGAPERIGYARPIAREGNALFSSRRVGGVELHASRFERNAALVRALGAPPRAALPPLELPADVERAFADLPAGFAALHPGTSARTPHKRWEPARFGELARRLRAEEGVETLVSFGSGASERAGAGEVVAASGGAARLAPPTPSVGHLLALLRRARVFVGNDSGPMHLASLAGIPLVAVFGPTDPVENAPFAGAPARVVRRDVGCNPCREGCPARTCLAAVDVESVLAALRELIARPPAVS